MLQELCAPSAKWQSTALAELYESSQYLTVFVTWGSNVVCVCTHFFDMST